MHQDFILVHFFNDSFSMIIENQAKFTRLLILYYFFFNFKNDKTSNIPKKRIHEIPKIFINKGLDKVTSLDFLNNKKIPSSINKIEPPIPNIGLLFFVF